MKINLLAIVLGFILVIGCGYAIYYIIQLILAGAFQENLYLLVAGGALAYLFIFALISGVILGIYLIISELTE